MSEPGRRNIEPADDAVKKAKDQCDTGFSVEDIFRPLANGELERNVPVPRATVGHYLSP